MSENIQSISQGTYTIGQTSATNFIAGPGIKIDEPSAGTVRIGNDETVLWELPTIGGTSTSATLSEDLTNFEKIEVWWAQQSQRTTVQYYYTKNLSQLFCVHGKYTAGQAGPHLFVAAWSISGTTASKAFCKYKAPDQWNNNNWTDANELCPCKIIGINRISGSNA